jgi:prephenate dehydrogenase (NADP+)
MPVPQDVTPQSLIEKQPVIGLIGMGAMGTMYAKHLVHAGWKKCVPSRKTPLIPA